MQSAKLSRPDGRVKISLQIRRLRHLHRSLVQIEFRTDRVNGLYWPPRRESTPTPCAAHGLRRAQSFWLCPAKRRRSFERPSAALLITPRREAIHFRCSRSAANPQALLANIPLQSTHAARRCYPPAERCPARKRLLRCVRLPRGAALPRLSGPDGQAMETQARPADNLAFLSPRPLCGFCALAPPFQLGQQLLKPLLRFRCRLWLSRRRVLCAHCAVAFIDGSCHCSIG